MCKKIYIILTGITLTFSVCLYAVNNYNQGQTKKAGKQYETDLPSLEINGNYISPNEGINISDARKLIINNLKKNGMKGDINSAMQVNEITTTEAWENAGVQLYKVIVDYAWFDGIAIIKNKKLLIMLRGMPTRAVFLADLDKDSIYEIYTNIFIGSGVISEEISGYNVALNESYHLSMRMKEDFNIYIENGTLMAEVRPFGNKENKNNKRTGKLILKEKDNKKELTVE